MEYAYLNVRNKNPAAAYALDPNNEESRK